MGAHFAFFTHGSRRDAVGATEHICPHFAAMAKLDLAAKPLKTIVITFQEDAPRSYLDTVKSCYRCLKRYILWALENFDDCDRHAKISTRRYVYTLRRYRSADDYEYLLERLYDSIITDDIRRLEFLVNAHAKLLRRVPRDQHLLALKYHEPRRALNEINLYKSTSKMLGAITAREMLLKYPGIDEYLADNILSYL
jgi:hypothetical protein